MIIGLSDNIFKAFIDKDNNNIFYLLKKLIHIYSRKTKRKKLHYFLKFYKACQILKYKGIKLSKINRRAYSNLFNDYSYRNNKEDNIRNDQLYKESNLYPFSPLINHSGYMIFHPNVYRNLTPITSRYRSYRSNNPLNQKLVNFTNPYLTQRNILTENDFYNNQHNNDEIEDDNYINQDYPNNYCLTNRNNKYSSFRNDLNRTDYGFYNPINKPKKRNKKINNIYSNKDEDINSKISEYLNDFDIQKNNLNINKPNYNNYNNKNEQNPKRNKSSNNIIAGTNYDINRRDPGGFNYNNIYNTNKKRNNEIENYFNKKISNKNNNYSNLNSNKNRTSYKKNNKKDKNSKKNSNTNNEKEEENKNNNKKIYNDSKDYYYSFNNKNNNNINNNKDTSKKNSNASLNPSSLGLDQMKTFYTNKPKITNNNNVVNSNHNSASSRMLDTQYHFLNGLKMMSGEINEYFYDFNSKREKKEKNEDEKSNQSLQSLSDSKMMEIANHYIGREDDSVENYQMNNIIYNRKKHNIK